MGGLFLAGNSCRGASARADRFCRHGTRGEGGSAIALAGFRSAAGDWSDRDFPWNAISARGRNPAAQDR